MKEKFHAHEYDIPLDRVSHCRGPHVLSFLIWAFVSELWPQMWETSIQGERNNWYQQCSNVLQFPIEIYSYEIFTRAPGSSLVGDKNITDLWTIVKRRHCRFYAGSDPTWVVVNSGPLVVVGLLTGLWSFELFRLGRLRWGLPSKLLLFQNCWPLHAALSCSCCRGSCHSCVGVRRLRGRRPSHVVHQAVENQQVWSATRISFEFPKYFSFSF